MKEGLLLINQSGQAWSSGPATMEHGSIFVTEADLICHSLLAA